MKETLADKFNRVKMIYEREISEQKMAIDADDIPVSYELISSQWLTHIICNRVPGAKVIEHHLDLPDEGTSNRRRIFLEYNQEGRDAGLPASVFCKATQSLESRFVLGLTGCGEAEAHFYNTLRPLINIEAPVGIHANADPESLNSITVMEDLKGKVMFCDQNTHISISMAKSQMRLLATLHGSFYGTTERSAVTQLFPLYEDWCDCLEEAVTWSKACQRGFLKAESVIPPNLFDRAEEIWPATMTAWNEHKHLPRTVTQGDVHLKNWYVAKNGEMGLGDWQCIVRAHWSKDLAYAISTALTVENRRKWEKELIQYYLDQLAGAGGPKVSLGEAMLHYRQQMLPALALWTGTLVPNEGAPHMQPSETSVEFIKRITHAIDDLECLESFA